MAKATGRREGWGRNRIKVRSAGGPLERSLPKVFARSLPHRLSLPDRGQSETTFLQVPSSLGAKPKRTRGGRLQGPSTLHFSRFLGQLKTGRRRLSIYFVLPSVPSRVGKTLIPDSRRFHSLYGPFGRDPTAFTKAFLSYRYLCPYIGSRLIDARNWATMSFPTSFATYTPVAAPRPQEEGSNGQSAPSFTQPTVLGPPFGPAATNPLPTSSIPTRSLPPLTTLWTRPTDCHFTFDHSRQGEEVTASLDITIEDPRTLSCYPPSFLVGSSSLSVGTYSPGLCPQGFTIARLFIQSAITTGLCQTL